MGQDGLVENYWVLTFWFYSVLAGIHLLPEVRLHNGLNEDPRAARIKGK